MDFDTLFFIGPQGSGKGTQAKRLGERLGFFYWEMGGVVRQVSQEDTPIGHKARAMHDSGVLLPDDFLIEIIKMRLSSIPESQGLIFDGVPRRIGQAEFLLDYLEQIHHTRMATIFIDLPREESISRLLARAATENRPDDSREAIEFRLTQYEQDTVPVLDYLRPRTRFITIDGSPPIEEVAAAIDTALQPKILNV
jgi:adenylate kinase